MYAGAEFRDGVFEGWKHADADYGRRHSLMAVKQDVKMLNENIVRYTVEKPLSQIAAKHGIRAEEIDWFLPHYSSGFFPRPPFRRPEKHRLRHSAGKWFTNLHSKGNTGSASIYIILEEFMRTFSHRTRPKKSCVTFQKAAAFQHVSCFWSSKGCLNED